MLSQDTLPQPSPLYRITHRITCGPVHLNNPDSMKYSPTTSYRVLLTSISTNKFILSDKFKFKARHATWRLNALTMQRNFSRVSLVLGYKDRPFNLAIERNLIQAKERHAFYPCLSGWDLPSKGTSMFR